jgi:membrane-associated phospholipid phosphatase
LFAAFCGFSRLELNRHWLSDMVAGHAVGFILGRTVVRGRNPLQFGRLDWAPSAAPGGGFTINVRLRLGPRK